MSGGAGGSILAMILSLKNNKTILPKRKSYREIRKIYYNSTSTQQLFNKKSDPKLLEAIRIQLKKERKVEITKRIFIICLSIVIAIGLFYIPFILIKNIGSTEKQRPLQNSYINYQKERFQAFEMFITYGDYHFGHKEYTLAIKNYKSALKSSPYMFHTKYDLAIIYYHACLDSSIYCQEAISSLSGIINESDTSQYALKLRSEVYMHLGEYTKAENDLNMIEEHK